MLRRTAGGNGRGRPGGAVFQGDPEELAGRHPGDPLSQLGSVVLQVAFELRHRVVGVALHELPIVKVVFDQNVSDCQGNHPIGPGPNGVPLVASACRLGKAAIEGNELGPCVDLLVEDADGPTLGDALDEASPKQVGFVGVRAEVEHVLGVGHVVDLNGCAPGELLSRPLVGAAEGPVGEVVGAPDSVAEPAGELLDWVVMSREE